MRKLLLSGSLIYRLILADRRENYAPDENRKQTFFAGREEGMYPFYEASISDIRLIDKEPGHTAPHLHRAMEFVYVTKGSLELGMARKPPDLLLTPHQTPTLPRTSSLLRVRRIFSD